MIKCNCNIWNGCTCGAIEEERRLLKEGKRLEDNKVKYIGPLKNCIIETNKEYSYFKFVKVDEGIRNKGSLGIFNGYKIRSMYSPDYSYYYGYKNIYIFGCMKQYDNEIVECNKEIISALEEAGCKVNIVD